MNSYSDCQLNLLGNSTISMSIENTLDFSYSHLFDLMQSANLSVQLKASSALATYLYNNPRIYSVVSENYQLSFSYFEKFLQSNDELIRCTAAFQVRTILPFVFSR